MSRRRSPAYLLRFGVMLALRHAPVPWPLKHWAIWLSQPKVVPVGVAIIPDAQGRVLILRARYSGLWLLPGGTLHAGESPAAGVVRECREELGLPVTVERLTGVYADRRKRELVCAFRCTPLTGTPMLAEEHETYRYVEAATAPPPLDVIVADALANSADVRMAEL